LREQQPLKNGPKKDGGWETEKLSERLNRKYKERGNSQEEKGRKGLKAVRET